MNRMMHFLVLKICRYRYKTQFTGKYIKRKKLRKLGNTGNTYIQALQATEHSAKLKFLPRIVESEGSN